MIKCYISDNLYHRSCVGITMEEAKKERMLLEKCGFVTIRDVRMHLERCLTQTDHDSQIRINKTATFQALQLVFVIL